MFTVEDKIFQVLYSFIYSYLIYFFDRVIFLLFLMPSESYMEYREH